MNKDNGRWWIMGHRSQQKLVPVEAWDQQIMIICRIYRFE